MPERRPDRRGQHDRFRRGGSGLDVRRVGIGPLAPRQQHRCNAAERDRQSGLNEDRQEDPAAGLVLPSVRQAVALEVDGKQPGQRCITPRKIRERSQNDAHDNAGALARQRRWFDLRPPTPLHA